MSKHNHLTMADASTIYNDAYMRDNLGDIGQVPATGCWTNSPDIIPNGTSLISNPVDSLTKSFANDVGKPTTWMNSNYFYVRGKNLSSGPCSALFELYYCPSHLFLFPGLWSQNQLLTSDGKNQVSATAKAANDIMVPDQPFTNIPITTEHCCLIGRVITDAHPNPLPSNITDMDALAKYMLDSPNMAWRNVVLVQSDVPTFTHTFDLDVGDKDCMVITGLSCKNISVGSSVAFSCGTPIPSGPDKGKVIELVRSTVTQSDIFIGQRQFYFPAGYKSHVSYSYWANPPIQIGWEVAFQAIAIIEPSHMLYDRAKCLTELGHPERLYDANGSLLKGVIVGQCSTMSK